MSDQYQFKDDFVNWDDWLQTEKLQPFWQDTVPSGEDLLPESEVPTHQQMNQDDLNLRFDSNLTSEGELPLAQRNGCYADRSFEPPAFEAQQLSLRRDSTSADITTTPCQGEQENHCPSFEASMNSNETSYLRRAVYPASACATCEAPLDISEQLLNIGNLDLRCTHDKSHLSLLCGWINCGEKFLGLEQLKAHSTWHPYLQCAVPGCARRLGQWEVGPHFRVSHPEIKYRCSQCGLQFDYSYELDSHGWQDRHGAYVCQYPECGSESSRLRELIRHQLTHRRDAPRYPCLHCRKYRGNNGFKRKDHLLQHIRNYHHIEDGAVDEAQSQDGPIMFPCHFENCDQVGANSFESLKLLRLHLKKDHPSPFQCEYPGCDRVGTKGWIRERDMVKHMKKIHGLEVHYE